MGQIFPKRPKPLPPVEDPALPGADSTGEKSVKLVLVGDSTVGKSSLIVNYYSQVFDERNESR